MVKKALRSQGDTELEDLAEANVRLRRELDESRRNEEKLRALVADQESFTYSVSHDLRAPMRALQGVAEALLEDYTERLDDTGRDYLTRIVAAARRMDAMINDLLVYNRMGRENRKLQACSLDQAVAESLLHLEREIRESGAEIRTEENLGTVHAHPTVLGMIVSNLVSNAVKFVEPGRRPEVSIRADREQSAGRIILWVEDRGIGIHPEHHAVIFKVFERLHGVEAYPGTGIGLAIARKGAESLDGKVGVLSEPGEGSQFWIDLPAAHP